MKHADYKNIISEVSILDPMKKNLHREEKYSSILFEIGTQIFPICHKLNQLF